MAEGYSHNPNQDASDDEVVKKRPEAGDRFRNFIGELFRPKADKEKKPADESDDEELTEKKKNTSESATKVGRFTRAWRLFFPKLASKEDLPTSDPRPESARAPRGLFFESNRVEDEPQDIEAAPLTTDTERHERQSEPAVESNIPSEVSETVAAEAPTNTDDTLPEARVEYVQHQADTETIVRDYTPEAVTAPSATTATERVVVNGLTNADRLRLRHIERRENEIERDTRHIKKELDKRSSSPASHTERVVPRGPEVVTARTAEKQTIREIQKEIVNKKIELTPRVERQRTPEKFAVKEQYSEVQKERIIESVLDKVDNKEVDTHKEISYELSHEAKDMDKQSAAAWTAMQADADAQAKANAAAIAAAQAAVGDQADSLKQIAKSQSAAMYQQAALGGFVAAVVIIAIIIVILLLK